MLNQTTDEALVPLNTQLDLKVCFMAPYNFNIIQVRGHIHIRSLLPAANVSLRETLLGENCVTNEHSAVSDLRASHKENVTHTLAVLNTRLWQCVFWTQRWNETEMSNYVVFFNWFCSWQPSVLWWELFWSESWAKNAGIISRWSRNVSQNLTAFENEVVFLFHYDVSTGLK